eukprot:CAMPEP_0181235706 /NCGR_PEP_ID=MMETSP1096-20121128/37734_1 /TAXON_ID=156174 ORGANISM="Chrysochromulina ericina, Strain CCMP281" /NCGR_SAMPLE_ID=MMETSP1096 /ASSEMBLY_ACC=CAM_ASM_000453 /LENGTH=91 /DNA_ID=CAMNT_0023330735 /DNA_START=145 /DNA_END=415 /DNA_ORIENTATION=-
MSAAPHPAGYLIRCGNKAPTASARPAAALTVLGKPEGLATADGRFVKWQSSDGRMMPSCDLVDSQLEDSQLEGSRLPVDSQEGIPSWDPLL